MKLGAGADLVIAASAAHSGSAWARKRRSQNWQRGGESFCLEQSRDEKQRDHGNAGAQVGQREFGQQRDGTEAGLA